MVRGSNYFVVGFQHIWYYGKARRLGPGGTVRHVPGLEYRQNRYRRMFTHGNRGNAIPREDTSPWRPRSDEAGSLVSRASTGDCCDTKTPGYASAKSLKRMPSVPIWRCNDLAGTWKAHRNGCTSAQPTETAYTRTDTISARNATCAT